MDRGSADSDQEVGVSPTRELADPRALLDAGVRTGSQQVRRHPPSEDGFTGTEDASDIPREFEELPGSGREVGAIG